MKRTLFFALAILLFAACDSGDDTPTTPPQGGTAPTVGGGNNGGNCAADCNGALANNPGLLCSAYDASFASGNVSCSAACTVDTSACVAAAGDSNPNPNPTQVAEFGDCFASTECTTGLECVGASGGAAGLCAVPCAGEGDTSCGANRECLPLSAQAGGGGFCMNATAMRDQECLVNNNLCAPGQGECSVTGFDAAGNPTSFHCKMLCESAAIGTQGTCGAGEQCLQNPLGLLNLQDNGSGQQVTCTNAGTQDICQAGYECVTVSGGQTVCAQFDAWCGTVIPLCGDLANASTACQTCSTEGSGICGVTGATGTAAQSECFIPEGGAVGVCIGYCESDTGVDLDCGAGYACVQPTPEESIYVVPQGGENYVNCTDDSACDATGGFTCLEVSVGSICARGLKMCMTAGAAPAN